MTEEIEVDGKVKIILPNILKSSKSKVDNSELENIIMDKREAFKNEKDLKWALSVVSEFSKIMQKIQEIALNEATTFIMEGLTDRLDEEEKIETDNIREEFESFYQSFMDNLRDLVDDGEDFKKLEKKFKIEFD